MTPTIEYLEVEGGGWFATIVDSLPKIQMFPKGQQGTLKAEHQVLQELPGNVSCTKAANPAVAAMCTLGKARREGRLKQTSRRSNLHTKSHCDHFAN